MSWLFRPLSPQPLPFSTPQPSSRSCSAAPSGAGGEGQAQLRQARGVWWVLGEGRSTPSVLLSPGAQLCHPLGLWGERPRTPSMHRVTSWCCVAPTQPHRIGPGAAVGFDPCCHHLTLPAWLSPQLPVLRERLLPLPLVQIPAHLHPQRRRLLLPGGARQALRGKASHLCSPPLVPSRPLALQGWV